MSFNLIGYDVVQFNRIRYDEKSDTMSFNLGSIVSNLHLDGLIVNLLALHDIDIVIHKVVQF